MPKTDKNLFADFMREIKKSFKESDTKNSSDKDVEFRELNKSLKDLVSTLKQRAGDSGTMADNTIAADSTEAPKKKKAPRTFTSDMKDFGKGLTSPFTDIKKYFSGEQQEVAKPKEVNQDFNINAISSDNTVAAQSDHPVAVDAIKNIEVQKPKKQGEARQSSLNDRLLANMVMALNELKDNKVQDKILDEAKSIRAIIEAKTTKQELPKGEEPNNEANEIANREALATSIADHINAKLSSGLPDIPQLPNTASNAAKAAGSAAMAAGVVTGVVAGGAALTYGATGALAAQEGHRKAYTKEQDKNGMLSAMSGDTGVAASILNEGQGKTKEDVAANDKKLERERDLLKDAPFLTKYYGVGRDKYLEKKEKELSDANKVTPKQAPNPMSKVIDEVNDKNTELKMYTDKPAASTGPIISNSVNNNNTQTFTPAPPIPHNNANGFTNWQNNRTQLKF